MDFTGVIALPTAVDTCMDPEAIQVTIHTGVDTEDIQTTDVWEADACTATCIVGVESAVVLLGTPHMDVILHLTPDTDLTTAGITDVTRSGAAIKLI